MPETQPANFERDPNAGAHLAGQFGAGAGNAETLIEANLMRFSEELLAANILPRDDDATAELDRSSVASAAGVDEKLVIDHAVRGSYVTYVTVDPVTGRTYKGVLVRDGDSLELPASSGDPNRARLQAHLQAAAELEAAREKAQQIVADAEAEAQKLVAKATQESEKQADEAGEKAAEERAAAEETPASGSGSGSGSRSRSRASS